MGRRVLGVGLAILGLLAAGLAGNARAQKDQQDVFSVEELCKKNYQTGLEFLKNQRFIDAKESFTAVVEACPDNADARMALGKVAINLRDYDLAIEQYEKARQLTPDNLDVLDLLAYAYSAAGRVDEAEGLYEEVLGKDPNRPAALQNLAFIYRKKGKLPESVMLDMKAVALSADSAAVDLPVSVGEKWLEAKYYPEVHVFYKNLMDRNPDDLQYARVVGFLYYRIGRYDDAVTIYRRIIAAEPNSSLNERKIVADALKRAGRTDEALAEMEYLLQAEPDDMKNFYTLSGLYKDAGQYQKAIAIADQGLGKHPEWGCLWYMKGDVLSSRAEAAQKAKDFETAISLYGEAKGLFQRAVNDATCGGSASKQVDRQDLLIDRAKKLRDKEAQGG